jgi:hypothetical protein
MIYMYVLILILLYWNRLQKQSLEEKKKGHTSKALYCLKRRKNLLEILDRRLKSMETMDTVLMKIETSQDDLQVRLSIYFN